jgi:hypothetical protein
MTAPGSGITYGRNFDGSVGDVLARLREILETTPPHALATRPVKRALIEAAVKEIERLRRAVAEAPR